MTIDRSEVSRCLAIARDDDGTFSTWAWPGRYPVYHVFDDMEPVCAKCANGEKEVHTDPPDDGWRIIGSDINWEDDALYCSHCDERIPSVYGDRTCDSCGVELSADPPREGEHDNLCHQCNEEG